jgi:deoxyribonuclease IV
MSKIQFGFHESFGEFKEKLPLRVKERGGECFQFFSRNPYGGKVEPLDPELVKNFKQNCQESGVTNSYVHAPYYINLASLNNRIFYGSIKALQVDMERAEQLGVKFVVTHIGSAKDFTDNSPLFQNFTKQYPEIPAKYQTTLAAMAEQKKFSSSAFGRVVEGLEKIVAGKKKIPLLIEIAAGAGAVLGVKFEELAYYLESVPAVTGLCFDTAHAFASGYDIRSREKLELVLGQIEKIIGKEKLKLIHLNDSIGGFESHIDRHAHLGQGNLGAEPFKYLVDYFTKKHYNIDMILETPTEEGLKKDLALLKKFRQV